jgi:hypothetical protein
MKLKLYLKCKKNNNKTMNYKPFKKKLIDNKNKFKTFKTNFFKNLINIIIFMKDNKSNFLKILLKLFLDNYNKILSKL